MEVANSADKAYQTLGKKDFDLILSDYYLPAVDGDEHIRALSKIAPHIPIVVISGQGDEKTAARSIQSGAEDYIVKTREALESMPAILERAIVKHHSHQQKRSHEIKRHLENHRRKFKKVLGEVEDIDRKLKRLKKTKVKRRSRSGKTEDSLNMEHFTQRIATLKKFVKNLFFKK